MNKFQIGNLSMLNGHHSNTRNKPNISSITSTVPCPCVTVEFKAKVTHPSYYNLVVDVYENEIGSVKVYMYYPTCVFLVNLAKVSAFRVCCSSSLVPPM